VIAQLVKGEFDLDGLALISAKIIIGIASLGVRVKSLDCL
jgi:hypothetical protein